MSKLDYDSIPASGEYEATQEIANQVEDVLDVAHLGPFSLDRESDGKQVYYYNATDNDGRPPLMVHIFDDSEVKLYTTAYGDATPQPGMHSLARKAVPRDESAIEWFKNNFIVSEH